MQFKPCDVIRPSIILEERRLPTAVPVSPPPAPAAVQFGPPFSSQNTVQLFNPLLALNQWALSILCAACQMPTGDLFAQAARGIWGPSVTTTFRPNSGVDKLGFGTAVLPRLHVLCCAGLQTELQRFAVLLASLSGEGEYAGMTTLRGFDLYAADVYANLPAGFLTSDCVFSGHSMGGAVAALLRAQNRRVNPGVFGAGVYFGSPKPSAQDLSLVEPREQQANFVTRYDLVPLLPPGSGSPNVASVAAQLALLGNPVASRFAFWNTFKPSSPYQVLDKTGFVTDDPLTWNTTNWLLAIGQLATPVFLTGLQDHDIALYARYLRAAISQVTDVPQWYNFALVKSTALAVGAPF